MPLQVVQIIYGAYKYEKKNYFEKKIFWKQLRSLWKWCKLYMVHATAMLHCTHLDKCGCGDDRDDYNHNNCDTHNCGDDDDENISYASSS